MARRKTASLGSASPGVIWRAAPPAPQPHSWLGGRPPRSASPIRVSSRELLRLAAPQPNSWVRGRPPRWASPIRVSSRELLRLAAPPLRSEADGEFHQVAEQEGVLPGGLG